MRKFGIDIIDVYGRACLIRMRMRNKQVRYRLRHVYVISFLRMRENQLLVLPPKARELNLKEAVRL